MTGPPVLGIDASRAVSLEPTGTENYSTALIEALDASAEFVTRLYVRPGDADAVPVTRGTVVELGPGRVWTHVALGREIALRPPDVLFVPAHVMPVGCRPPAVVTVHDLGHRTHPAGHTWRQVRYLEWSTRHHVAKARRLVADSESTRRDLVSLYGADPLRVVVAPLGVGSRFRPVPEQGLGAARAALGVAEGRRYVLHVGTVQPRKNLDSLVRAFARIAASHPDVDLILVGRPGWGASDPGATARRAGLGDRVRTIGYLPTQLLAAAYSGAAVTALPSFYEGFGLTALESMACGAPVAASNASSIPEVVGDAAILFDPTDKNAIARALDRLLGDRELCTRLSRAGIERARRFTWQACAGAVEMALVDALAGDGATIASGRSP